MSDFKLPESLAFKAEDFHKLFSDYDAFIIAGVANALLTERLAKLETVYMAKGYGHHDTWTKNERDLDDHADLATKILPPWRIEE